MKTSSFPASLILCAAVLGFAACAAQQGGDGRAAAGTDEAEAAPSGDGDAGRGEVPAELLAEIVDDLAAKTGTERSAIEVLRAEAVTWGDSSLGCPEPGMMYAQALTDGYWVILGHSGEEHDYRARRGGSLLLCARPDRKIRGSDRRDNLRVLAQQQSG